MTKATSIQCLASLLAVPLAASMLLAGCGGDGKPDATSSTTGSSPSITATLPTATNNPTTSAPKVDPDIPAAAKAHTPAGAEAFVRYYIERSNVAWTQPRAGILSPLCQASAKGCAALEKTAARLTAAGHRYDGDPVTIKFIGALGSSGPNHQDVLATVVQERRSEIDAAGKRYLTDKREELRIDFDVLYTGQAWSVSSSEVMK